MAATEEPRIHGLTYSEWLGPSEEPLALDVLRIAWRLEDLAEYQIERRRFDEAERILAKAGELHVVALTGRHP